MAYATLAQLTARCGEAELIQLTDPDGLAIDPDVVEEAQAQADGEIDSFLARRYTVPVSGASDPALPMLSCSITRFRLWRDERPEHVIYDYEQALKALAQYAAGTRELIGAAGVAAGSSGEALVMMASSGGLWDRSNGGYL